MRFIAAVVLAVLVGSPSAFAAPKPSAKHDAIRAKVAELRASDPHLKHQPEQPVVTDGTLEILIEDHIAAGTSTRTDTLVTPSGERLQLHYPEDPPALRHGQRVRLKGIKLDGHAVVEEAEDVGYLTDGPGSTGAAAGAEPVSALSAPMTRKIAVILYHWSTQTAPWTVDYTRGNMYTNPLSVSKYYEEVSYGQTLIRGHLNPTTGDVFGWYVLPGAPPGCGQGGASDAAALAAADGFVDSNYQHVIYAFAGTSCGWVGMAEYWGRRAYINHGWFDVGIVSHELGHNLGLGHARSKSCTSGGVPVALSPTCTTAEYGDRFDIMGGASLHRHFKPENKNARGWLAPENIQTVTTDGTYAVAPHELASPGVQMLSIAEVGQPGFSVEFRQPYGVFDDFAPTDPAVNGTLIRDDSLLDMTPGSAGGFLDAALPAGQTFTDPATGLKIKTSSVSASGAAVQVTFGACARKFPGASINPWSQTAPPGGTPLVYAIGAQNLDFIKCGASNFTVSPTLPGPGWTISPSTASGSLAPGAWRLWDFTITPPASAPEGLYAIDFVIRNTASGMTYPVSVQYEIKIPDTTPPAFVTITAPVSGAVYTSAQMVTIAAGAAPDTQRVEFYDNGMMMGMRWGAPFEQFWMIDTWNNGPHALTARAYDEAGNFLDSAPVNVTVAIGTSDLVLTSLTTTSTTVAPGSALSGRSTAKNQGTGAAEASVTRFSLSTDAVYGGTNDVALPETRAVAALAAGVSTTSNTTLTVPAGTAPGAYYLCATADSAGTVSETDETNNTRCTTTALTVAPADLVMTAVSGPSSGLTGTSISISSTVRNQGTGTVSSSTVGLYLSTDATITTSDTRVGTASISSLAPGASSSATKTVSLSASMAPGTYYVGAIADYTNARPESNETNNARTGNAIVVTPGADLVMTSVSGPSTGTRGGSIAVATTAANQGTGSAASFYVGIYLSTDATVTTADRYLGRRSISSLAGGASSTATTNVTIPSTLTPGTYYLGAIADYQASRAEQSETNNARAGNTIAVP